MAAREARFYPSLAAKGAVEFIVLEPEETNID